jgi:hypothetical protein
MAEETQPEVTPSGPTARVADSYGLNPHEHKPSQDPWVAETAGDKQAGTSGVEVSCPGSSSSTSENDSESSSPKTGQDSTPARTAASHSAPDPTASSSARSTATGRSGRSGKAEH